MSENVPIYFKLESVTEVTQEDLIKRGVVCDKCGRNWEQDEIAITHLLEWEIMNFQYWLCYDDYHNLVVKQDKVV